jgi:endonuclease-3
MNQTNKSLLLKLLKKEYGIPKTELNFNSPFELLISVMLSAQSTDKKVNEVTSVLFKKYPTAKELSKAKVRDVENIIREVNYYKTKAKHLVLTSNILIETYSGKLPRTHEQLILLPGVGNKTANVVMSELKLGYAFPVDTHVFRVSKRLGLAISSNRDKVEKELCEKFPEKRWHELHHWFIFHGRRVCMARNPKCDLCILNKICPKIS